MLEFKTGNINDAALITDIGARSFIESHGKSASETDIRNYVQSKFNIPQLESELADENSIFQIAYYNQQPAAYSKITLNCPNPNIAEQKVCKMDRRYVLEEYFDKKIGQVLFDLNVEIAKQHQQKGIWLYVWTGNPRALRFYEKQGFKIVGETYFKISDTHSNPNYWMYLEF